MNRISNGIDSLIPLGWREWVSFPKWEIGYINAKVDTGAGTSSLHAEDINFREIDGTPMVEFTVFPWQGNNNDKKTITAEFVSFRNIRSSSGYLEERPVVLADIIVAGREFKTELTLTNRELMGFRMLLGRKALNDHFSVVPCKSYLGIKAPASVRRLNNGGN